MNTIRKKLIEVALPLGRHQLCVGAREVYPPRAPQYPAPVVGTAASCGGAGCAIRPDCGRPILAPRVVPLQRKPRAQERQRRLFGIIEEMVKWENTTNETVLEAARGGDTGKLATHL